MEIKQVDLVNISFFRGSTADEFDSSRDFIKNMITNCLQGFKFNPAKEDAANTMAMEERTEIRFGDPDNVKAFDDVEVKIKVIQEEERIKWSINPNIVIDKNDMLLFRCRIQTDIKKSFQLELLCKEGDSFWDNYDDIPLEYAINFNFDN